MFRERMHTCLHAEFTVLRRTEHCCVAAVAGVPFLLMLLLLLLLLLLPLPLLLLRVLLWK
jgi:hypothetical protein